MQFYEVGKTYEFDVIQTDDLSESFFRLLLNDGITEIKLPKIKFQQDRELPIMLKCRVKAIDQDIPIVDHFIPQYVNEFYGKGALRGEIFNFKVTSVPTRAGDPFSLCDTYGINYRLYEPGALLTTDQIVKCKFEKLDTFKFILKRVDDGLQLPFFTLDEICDQLKIGAIERNFIANTIMKLPAMSAAAEELAKCNPHWPLTFLHSIEQHLAEWFISPKVRQHNRAFRLLLNHYRQAGLLLLEDSNFLSNCDDDRRQNVQIQLTGLIEAVDPYITTLRIITDGTQDEFVEGLMDKLRKSGYLYHPTLQFSILMLIFRLFPKMIDSSLSRIFDVIMGRRLSTWTANTFSNAFVEQFEIYIRQARKDIDDLPQAESSDENHRLETIITAIALQLFMANPETFPAFDRNMSLFYRYISLLRPVKNRDLLTKSLMALLGVKMPMNFGYDQIKEPMMMMTAATIMTPMAELSSLTSVHALQAGNISVRISNEGIAISRLDMPTNERVIPNGLMSWLQPQIYHKGISPIKSNKLEAHNKWWREIENDLFGARPTSGINNSQPTQSHRHQASVGDDVYVIVTGTDYDEKGNPILLCRIDDDEIDSASGYILREDIVGYRISQIPGQAYLSDRGIPYHFYAQVIDAFADGSFRFSLKNEIERAIHDIVDYNTEYLAVITSDPNPDYSAICSKGFGLYLECDSKDDAYMTTDKVKFRIIGTTPYGAYRGVITGDASDEDNIDNLRAFTYIMREIACVKGSDDEDYLDFMSDNESSAENFEILKKEDLREVIDIIRFKVVADKELVEAFDYLNFARILALIIEEKEVAELLSVHSSLLIMHEYFATNSNVDSEKLLSYSDLACSNPQLNILYKRLELVSWLGDKDKINELLEIVNSARNELEATLARMVLSYNMIVESETSDNEIADSIKNKIKKLLRVNSETRQLKYYGSESLYVEFKSSIVFPARRKGEKAIANPEQQQFIILRVIASFLNAGGGTLYIGVNDSTHYESGLQDDFDYYKNHHAQVGPFTNKIKDVDGVAVFLANLVHYKFHDAVSRLIDIAPDNDASKAVVVVKVKQSLEPVKLNDAYYERQSSTIRELRNPEELRRFIAERKALKILQQERIKAADKTENSEISHSDEQTDILKVTEETNVTTSTESSEVASQPSIINASDAIHTSTWRHNVLHDYQDNFVAPQAYIYFDKESGIKYSRQDDYAEDDSNLTLIVGDNERNAYLLLVYAGNLAIKVSISDLFKLKPRESVKLYNGATLQYASIVQPGDGLLSIHSDSRDALWQRVTPIKDIQLGHIGSTPAKIMETAVKTTLLYETVDTSVMPNFAKSMPGEIRTNDIGFNMHRKLDGVNAKEAIDNLLASCSNQKIDA